ncbi:hypothetical protein CWC05_03485 [Pseudoalteromonas ruthenica]|uniref:Gp5/Type VI secretion system Vgr protein OB-fold domain-containing protein n=1 Tax=Pseudoalteromonas ruthenica TaxID=151081 RepID=A0A5S3Z8B5_9GAMM|nr:hypothetical protein [Pseudoalteromonas ruthenica]TMP88504.1 hypothetical protein CWC05_03485 [Pseudoalteromonas ruthenica]
MVPAAVRRLIERFHPELKQRQHVPQLARIEAVYDLPSQDAQISTPFRAHLAVDIQLLTPSGEPKNTPVYEQVPLAVSVAASDAGVELSPHVGMQCLIQFIDGNNAMPVITHLLPFGQLVNERKRTDVSLKQSACSQVRGTNGDWHIHTDGELAQSANTMSIQSRRRSEHYHQKSTSIDSHDSTHVEGNQLNTILGSLKTTVGEKALLIALDNMHLGSQKQVDIKAHGNMNLETLKTLHAKAANLAKLEGQTVWVGNESVNVLQILLDLIAVVKNTNQTLAMHTHEGAGKSQQSGQFTGYQSTAAGLGNLLSPITEQ